MKEDMKAVLDTAGRAGRMLLESGAEISRVEESMERICRHYRIEGESFYVLTNGIFLTAEGNDGECYARAEHIPISAVRMDRIEALNQLSREIEQGHYTTEQAEEAMDKIAALPAPGKLNQVIACGAGAAAFAFLPGEGLPGTAAVFLSGVLLQLLLFWSGAHFSKATGTILGSAAVSAVCCFFYRIGVGTALNYMIIGAIMPLIPGVGFVVAIRDIVEGDYLSGFIRLLDALLLFFCIALGVAITLSLANAFFGGFLTWN